jgi:hypothetical protein
MKLGKTDFIHIDTIKPSLVDDPGPRYKNKNNLPKHRFGNGPFCKFQIPSHHPTLGKLNVVGVYALVDQRSNILYIGRCSSYKSSTLIKRFNNGYGHISPRACYRGAKRPIAISIIKSSSII